MYDQGKMEKLKRKSYRTAYLDAHVRTRLAFQIRAIRKQLGLNQYDFAKKIGKPQSVVARLENPDGGLPSLRTLLEVAHALDVALLVQFAAYSEYLEKSEDVSPSALAVESFHCEEAHLLAKRILIQPTSITGFANAQVPIVSFRGNGELEWAIHSMEAVPAQGVLHTEMFMQTTA